MRSSTKKSSKQITNSSKYLTTTSKHINVERLKPITVERAWEGLKMEKEELVYKIKELREEHWELQEVMGRL